MYTKKIAITLAMIAAAFMLAGLPARGVHAQGVPTASIALVRSSVTVGGATGGPVTIANKVQGRSYTIQFALTTANLSFRPDCQAGSGGISSMNVAENDHVVIYGCLRGSGGIRIVTTDSTTNRVVSQPFTTVNVVSSPSPPAPTVSWNSGVNPGGSYLYTLKSTITNSGDSWSGPVQIQFGTGPLRRAGYLDSNAQNIVITDGSGRRLPGTLVRFPNATKGLIAYTTATSGDSDVIMYMGGSNGAPSSIVTSGFQAQATNIRLVRYTQNNEFTFDIRIDDITPWDYAWRGGGFDIIPTSMSETVVNCLIRITSGAAPGFTHPPTTGFPLTRHRFHRISIVQSTDRLHMFLDGNEVVNPTIVGALARTAQAKGVDPWRTDEVGAIYTMTGGISGGIGPIRIRDTVSNTTLSEWIFRGQSTVLTQTRDGSSTNVADTWSASTPNEVRGGPSFGFSFATRPHPAVDQFSIATSPIGITARGDVAVRSDTRGGGAESESPGNLGLNEDTAGLSGLLAPLREGATRSAGGTAWLVMASLVGVGVGGRVMRASNSMLAAAGASVLIFAIGAVALGIPLVWTAVIAISLIASSLIYTHAR